MTRHESHSGRTAFERALRSEQARSERYVATWRRIRRSTRDRAGLACTCPPGCTDRTWGDGGTCARGCVPCREMQGAPYVPKPKSKKAAPGGQVNTTEESDAA